MALTKKGEKACAYPDCTKTVDEDDHCYGCGFYICERHSTNVDIGGHGHDVVEHWTDEDDE